MAITMDMKIIDILNENSDNAKILMECGMHCVGCIAARGETLEQAAAVHGIPVEDILAKLNQE